MKIGDRIRCDNNQIYTLGDSKDYTFTVIDENGKIVNEVMDSYLEECLNFDFEDKKYLCVGKNIYDDFIYVKVLELIETRKGKCPQFGSSDGMNGSCHYCLELDERTFKLCNIKEKILSYIKRNTDIYLESCNFNKDMLDNLKYYIENIV